jgi:hypothetical protein
VAKNKRGGRLDADDVLEGRARPNARELIALIHDVNPSGHDLSARDTARRYAQKSRLQSLLIHRYAEEILVEPTDEPGVIGLRHRSSGADACHAVLASLDDDARSWAQRQIDLGADEEEEGASALQALPQEDGDEAPPPDAPLEDLSTGEILRRGRAALEEYDFEAARTCFEAAFERGRMEAGVLLLTVLAEHLGLDREALALEERFDRETLDAPEARLLLAQAAARTYDRERAVRLARAETGDAAADVFVALARGALERDDLALLASDVGEIQRRGPTHPALLGLVDTLKKRRAEARAPLEANAQRSESEGRFEEAEAQAEAILARFGESAVANAILRAGQERRRRDEGQSLANEGRIALEAGEGARAVGLLRRAMMLLKGEEAASAQGALARAEALDRDQAENAKAHAVAQLLETGSTLRGLTEYAALDDERRALVKARCAMAELVLLDQTGIHGAGPDAKGAAQAVMALQRAIAISPKDTSAAFELLAANWTYLHVVEIAGQLAALVQESHQLRLMTAAIERFTAGMSAFDGTREGLTRALKILATVKREHLDKPEEYDKMVARLRRADERMERAKEVGKLRDAGDLVGAKKALEGLMRFEEAGLEIDHDPDDPAGPIDWAKKRDEVLRDMARICDLRVTGGPAADDLLGLEAMPLFDVPASLLPGGRELVFGEAHQGLIFLQAFDLERGLPTRRASLRMKNAFTVSRIQQNGGNVALMGSDATCIEVDPKSWEIVRAVSLGDGAGVLHQSVLAPGGRFFWNTEIRDGWWIAFTVEDNERSVYVKNQSEPARRISIRPLLGLAEPRVVMIRDRGAVTVYESRGAPVGSTHEGIAALRNGIAVHPSGKGLFAILREGAWGAFRAVWAELLPDATLVRAPEGKDRLLADLDPDARCETAVALEAGMVFVLGHRKTATSAKCLLGFAARDGGIERCFDVDVPLRVTLAQDEAARAVLALSPHDAGVEVVRLGREAPVFRAEAPRSAPLCVRALTVVPLEPCAPRDMRLWTMDGENGPGGFMGIELLRGLAPEERREMIRGVLEDPADKPAIVARFAALRKVPLPAFLDEFEAAALARYAGDPEMEQIPAQRAAHAGDWATVKTILSPIDPTPLGDAAAQHHDHLLGAALLMTGDADGARRVIARGAARNNGACDLSTLLALLGEEADGACKRASHAGVRALDRAVRGADARLAAGDFPGARRELAGLVVREAAEVQTLARRCRAWLSEPDETEPGGDRLDGFARRLALASFLSAHAEKAPDRRRELPFVGAQWDAQKLDALAAEARKWLEGDQKRPRPQ